jgi:hypothetical protein
MSEFINTIDLLGDQVVLASIIDKSITEFKDNVITNVGDFTFSMCPLTTIVLPNVTSIGQNNFDENVNITTAELPNVKTIGNYAFYRCSNLEPFNLTNVETIGNYAFNMFPKLKELYLPNANSIGLKAFEYCSNLKKVDLASSESGTMSNSAFNYCTSLTTVIIRSTTKWNITSGQPFENTPIRSGTGFVYVPRETIESYKTGSYWGNIKNQYRILEDYTVDGTITGELDWNKVNPTITRALIERTITSYTDSDSIRVKARTFEGCTSLKFVDLASCKYLSATGGSANQFANCSSLETIILRSSTMCTLSATSIFTNTPIESGTGFIYVPSALVDTYKSATNWSVFASQFRAIEDYPEICGGGN